MIARAERIAVGVDEGEDALLLVVVQPLPDMGQHDDDADKGGDEIDPAHAGEEQQPAADDAEQRRGAEIGLIEREQ